MNKTFTLIMGILLPFLSFSQRNFYRYGFGLGAGITNNHGDLPTSTSKDLITANLDYFLSPYLQAGLEIQSGKIYGSSNDSRFYQNHFKSVFCLGKAHIGQLMRQRGYPMGTKATVLKVVKGIYAGSGLGLVMSHQKNIFRDDTDTRTLGADKSIDAAIPVTIGLDNSGFESRIITGISYQGHFALGDQLDGYAPPGSKRDYYSTLVVSLKLRFGPAGIY